MRVILLYALLVSTQWVYGQNDQLGIFKNLTGSTWISEGKQLGGHDGKTVKEFTEGLNGNIIKVKTYTTDPQTLEFGLRNEGVRIFDKETQQLEFYEFDKTGGVSKGVILVENKSLHYQYQYGDLTLRDSWIYQSENEYLYRVCSINADEICEQTYHQGRFFRQKE